MGFFDKAKALVLKSAEAGVDYVKIKFTSQKLLLCKARIVVFRSSQIEGTVYISYMPCHDPWEWHRPVRIC